MTGHDKFLGALRGSAYVVAIVIACVLFQSSSAQDATTKHDEPKVKAAVEEVAVLAVCPDQILLEVAEIELEDCRSHVAKIAPICWHLIDRVISDYEIEQGEMGKEQFLNIAAIYSSCVRAEILRQIVKSKRESSSE
jgi:hypothetical protein